jgi:hypothetical protein
MPSFLFLPVLFSLLESSFISSCLVSLLLLPDLFSLPVCSLLSSGLLSSLFWLFFALSYLFLLGLLNLNAVCSTYRSCTLVETALTPK